MRILAVADTEAKYYYDYYTPGKLDEFDLILACGDLRREYLGHLSDVVMVSAASLAADRLGGADYDGDLIRTITDPIVTNASCATTNTNATSP